MSMRDILQKVAEGSVSISEAESALRGRIIDASTVGALDVDRELRTGVPEVIIAEGKTPGDLASVVRAMAAHRGCALVTRLIPSRKAETKGWRLPVRYDEVSQVCVVCPGKAPKTRLGKIGIITAGTSDIPVAEEARITAEFIGCDVKTSYDVGVAGAHRFAPVLKAMADWGADVLIVAAGREGALPTLISAIVDIPVIGLPVSTGYGHGGHGETALSAMLQSCSPIVVVNIDAGFVAGAAASRIARRAAASRGGAEPAKRGR